MCERYRKLKSMRLPSHLLVLQQNRSQVLSGQYWSDQPPCSGRNSTSGRNEPNKAKRLLCWADVASPTVGIVVIITVVTSSARLLMASSSPPNGSTAQLLRRQ